LIAQDYTLAASGEDFASLYDGRPKVIVHDTATLDGVQSVMSDHVTILHLHMEDQTLLLSRTPRHTQHQATAAHSLRKKLPIATEAYPLTSAPSNIAAIWAFNQQQAELLQLFCDWTEMRYGKPLAAVEVGDASELLLKLTATAFATAAQYQRRSTDLNNALSQIRIEHEETRQTLYRMQGLLWNIHDHPVKQTFSSRVGRTSFHPKELASAVEKTVVQPLPISGRGFAGVDLFVVEPSEAAGLLLCTLRDTATKESYGQWIANYSSIQSGWLNFSLPIVLDANPQFMELVLQFTGSEDDGPSLGVSDTVIFGQASASSTGKTLALRTWAGLPGLKNEATASNVHWIDDAKWFEYVLPKNVFAEARKGIEHPSDFEYLVRHSDGRMLLHPLNNVEVSAFIPYLMPNRTVS